MTIPQSPTISGKTMTLRQRTPADDAALLAMLREPEVEEYWNRWTAEKVVNELEFEGQQGWVIEIDGMMAGWVAAVPEEEPDFRHCGIDITLAEHFRGKGYGQEAIRLVVEHYMAQGHHRFTIDPRATNERAIRSYTAIGFKPVGILRSYERTNEGTWVDGLLMDMLVPDELAPRRP